MDTIDKSFNLHTPNTTRRDTSIRNSTGIWSKAAQGVRRNDIIPRKAIVCWRTVSAPVGWSPGSGLPSTLLRPLLRKSMMLGACCYFGILLVLFVFCCVRLDGNVCQRNGSRWRFLFSISSLPTKTQNCKSISLIGYALSPNMCCCWCS